MSQLERVPEPEDRQKILLEELNLSRSIDGNIEDVPAEEAPKIRKYL